MNLIPDSNIVISGLITPNGTISKLIFKDLTSSSLICPVFLIDEVRSKNDKIIKLTGLNQEQLDELIFRFFRHIDFIDNELIDFDFQQQAYNLVADVDKKDLLFVALSIQTGYTLWTGDKKLVTGLKKKGFTKAIGTKELIKLLEQPIK